MSTVSQAIAYWQGLQSKVSLLAERAILEHKEEIIGLLIHQQFEEGIDSNGNPLREYSPGYKKHKLLEGKSGKTDLENTGEFHATLDLTVVDDEFFLNSPSLTDQGELKSDWLNTWNEARGGSSVMKLTSANLQIASELVMPTFRELCNAELALD